MGYRTVAFVFLLGLAAVIAPPAHACGFGEAPGDCGETPESVARDMLRRVVAALQTDESHALEEFTHGEAGFRTIDNYVFCVDGSGIMSAHPNPALQGTDVRDLHDSKGNHFIARMMETAKPGQVSSIRYLFPRPGGTREYPKTTYYTRAGNQVCGVGVYDGSENAGTDAPLTPRARLTQLRNRLTAGMPANLQGDWATFQRELDETEAAKAAAFAKVREQVNAAQTVIATDSPPAAR